MSKCSQRCKSYGSIRDGSRAVRYDEGVVYCRHCSTFMKYVGKYCPCCSCLVRHGPRYMGKNGL